MYFNLIENKRVKEESPYFCFQIDGKETFENAVSVVSTLHCSSNFQGMDNTYVNWKLITISIKRPFQTNWRKEIDTIGTTNGNMELFIG